MHNSSFFFITISKRVLQSTEVKVSSSGIRKLRRTNDRIANASKNKKKNCLTKTSCTTGEEHKTC